MLSDRKKIRVLVVDDSALMRKLIPQFGEARLQSRGDAFTTLARSIVGHQISVKSAQSIWSRFAALADRIRAELLEQGVVLQDSPQGTSWVRA